MLLKRGIENGSTNMLKLIAKMDHMEVANSKFFSSCI